jgi:hypothetical protein
MSYQEFLQNLRKESDKDPLEDVSFDMKMEIDEDVFRKIMYWIDKADFEVSGLGKIIVDKERNVIRVVDAILLKQEGSSAATELDAAAIGKAMFLLKDTPGDLRWWWHSHVNMNVFWSGTDQGTIKQLGTGGWFTATVFNKKREMKSAFVQSSPVRLVVEDVPTKVDQHVDKSEQEQWDKAYAENVIEKTCSFPSSFINEGGVVHSMEDIVAEYHKRWPDEDVQETSRAVGFTAENAEPEDEGEETPTVEMTEEEYKVYSESCDVLFARHDRGEINDDELDRAINAINAKYGFDTTVEDDDSNVLTDEEAAAMDLGTSRHEVKDDEEDMRGFMGKYRGND